MLNKPGSKRREELMLAFRSEKATVCKHNGQTVKDRKVLRPYCHGAALDHIGNRKGIKEKEVMDRKDGPLDKREEAGAIWEEKTK